MQGVSGLLIIHNEERYIERALSSLLWCDEIVVIDSLSTDRTPVICKNPQAPWAGKIRFFENPWPGFSEQRNYALSQAKYNWVFFLDGDEACTPELVEEIRGLTTAKSPLQVYRVHRKEFFLGKPIQYGIWNPSYPTRLFPRLGVKHIGTVHEGLESDYPVARTHSSILHVEDLRIERILSKLNHYTSLQAETDRRNGKRTNLLRILFAFPAMFCKNYFYYSAYKDGVEGFIISVLEGVSRTVKHLKIWQIQHLKSKPKSL